MMMVATMMMVAMMMMIMVATMMHDETDGDHVHDCDNYVNDDDGV